MRKITNSSTFLNDGIEIVKLVKVYDGDTAIFQTKNGQIDIRFLGIDAPEYTKKIEPYGKNATEFCKQCLQNSKYIVIESDANIAEKDSTKSRYLAYIWYGESLSKLSLYQKDILKCGLAKTLIFNNVTLYNDVLNSSNKYAKKHNLGIYSGNDPEYCYEMIDSNIEDISKGFLQEGTTVRTKGIITGKCNTSFFVKDNDYSIYVYNTNHLYSSLKVGDLISFTGQYSNDDIYGIQVSNISDIDIISHNNKYDLLEYKNDLVSLHGHVILLNKCIIKKIYKSGKKGFIKGIINNDEITIQVSSQYNLDTVKSKFLINHSYSLRIGVIQNRNSYYEDPIKVLIMLNNTVKSAKEIKE